MATFGSAGSINYPDRKAMTDGHALRPTCSSTRHSSLGDQKSLEAEALAEVGEPCKAFPDHENMTCNKCSRESFQKCQAETL